MRQVGRPGKPLFCYPRLIGNIGERLHEGRGESNATQGRVDGQHARTRKLLKLGKEFVVHFLRHTFGTRMGEDGADAFEIKRPMGHSTVAVSQLYVHPSPESLERDLERLESLNERAAVCLPEPRKSKKGSLPATVSATVEAPANWLTTM